MLIQEYLDQHSKSHGESGRRLKVHVLGWNRGAVFLYVATETDGTHILHTSKGKTYRTKNNLLSLRDGIK